MPCALCLQDKELRNSHIIPEFLYEPLYDSKHRLQIFSVLPGQGNAFEQKGLRQHLLCDDCEQRLSVWEGYARLALKGGVSITARPEGNVLYISELDYVKFRLFQLSVLWRAGVSTLQFFENVRLGSHAERLRKLLLAGDTGPPNHYACFMFGLKFEQGGVPDLIMQPGKLKLHGQHAYRFVFGGFLWAFLVSNQDLPTSHRVTTLQPDGTTVIVLRDIAEMKDLASFALELQRLGRQP